MNVTESNALLELVPEPYRENTKWIATDRTGDRAAFFEKPTLNADGYWESNQPYYVIDRVDPKGWQKSLVRIEHDLTLRQFAYVALTLLAALAAALVFITR